MTVAELVQKLNAIHDKSIDVMFFCPKCSKFVELDDMKQLGFAVSSNSYLAKME